MSRSQQSDSLSTDTNVPMSGTGSSTAEAAAGNAAYSTWPWEVMLATILGIGAPDRAEVTGQPWLTIQNDGLGAAGMHLIWTAGWHDSPTSAAASIQVYLNPALYTTGGAWDRFLSAPAQAMSGVASKNYAGLPLYPPDFQAASLAVTSVTNWMATAADQFATLHSEAASGPVARFQGNLAEVVAELLGDLRTFMSSMHEQMTSPVSYGASIATAGDAAAQFLTDLMSAYSGWTQVLEHSPLGAVVQVLEAIATRDSSGAYVIPDPQNTPYGDLTASGAWAAVEQQAKNLWMSALSGGSPDFAGLDPLGRAALSKLVDQFGATTAAIVPVLGPAPPPLQPNPVQPGSGPGGPGGGPSAAFVTGGGQGQGGPGGGPAVFAASVSHGSASTASPTLGPGHATTDLAVQTGGSQTGAPGATVASPVVFLAAGPGGGISPGGRPALSGTAADLAATVDGNLLAGDRSAAANAQGPHGGLSGAIGASAAARGLLGDLALSAAESGGFTGTIGHPREARTRTDSLPAGRRHRGVRRKAIPVGLRQAPAAGFSLGRDPGGAVLQQSAVPAIAARPPAVTSSPINSQLTPVPSGLRMASGSPVPGAPVGSPASALAGAPDGAPGMLGEPAMLGPGSVSIGGISAGGPGAGAVTGADGPMMPPPGGMGMGMGIRGGQASGEQERRAYLPEVAESWGTAPGLAEGSLGADDHDGYDADEAEFALAPSAAVGIGAQMEDEPTAEHNSDRRMP